VRLQVDLARLTEDALDVFETMEKLVPEAEKLLVVVNYLADTGHRLASDHEGWEELERYLAASGYRALSDVLHLIHGRLYDSPLISGELTASGRAVAEATVATLRAARAEAGR
jgi:hypothetical protein